MTSLYVSLWGDGLGSPGLSSRLLAMRGVTRWFLAELNRIPSGVLGGRVDAVTSCVSLRGDDFGSPGLSSCKQSIERVAGHQEKGGSSSSVGSRLRCADSIVQSVIVALVPACWRQQHSRKAEGGPPAGTFSSFIGRFPCCTLREGNSR